MREFWTPEFTHQYESFLKSDRVLIDDLLDEILDSHTSRDMRLSLRRVAGSSVWSTRQIRLSRTFIRVAWCYAHDSRDSIVMVTIGEFP
ncbi:MAG: hypothetical protein ACFCU2_03260 [Acidimicrobiia bacterium]